MAQTAQHLDQSLWRPTGSHRVPEAGFNSQLSSRPGRAMSLPGYAVIGRYEVRCRMNLGEGQFGLGTLSLIIFSPLSLCSAPNGAPIRIAKERIDKQDPETLGELPVLIALADHCRPFPDESDQKLTHFIC
jgi:hypothetical protein